MASSVLWGMFLLSASLLFAEFIWMIAFWYAFHFTSDGLKLSSSTIATRMALQLQEKSQLNVRLLVKAWQRANCCFLGNASRLRKYNRNANQQCVTQIDMASSVNNSHLFNAVVPTVGFLRRFQRATWRKCWMSPLFHWFEVRTVSVLIRSFTLTPLQ